jgi:hypothetical protein
MHSTILLHGEHDLNITIHHCPDDGTPVDAVAELVTNVFDANAELGLDCDPVLEGSGAGTVIEIRDVGRGLDKSSFAIGRQGESAADNAQKRFGQCGMGLKDSIAMLVRSGFQITIHSRVSDFDFFVRSGGLAVSTIWTRVLLPSTEQHGTKIILRRVGGFVHLADRASDSPLARCCGRSRRDFWPSRRKRQK